MANIEAYEFTCMARSYVSAEGRIFIRGQKLHLSPAHADYDYFNNLGCFKKERRDVPPEDARKVGAVLPEESGPEDQPSEPGSSPSSENPEPADLSGLDLDEGTYEALLENGLETVEKLAEFDTIEKLTELKNIGESRAKKILAAFKTKLQE